MKKNYQDSLKNESPQDRVTVGCNRESNLDINDTNENLKNKFMDETLKTMEDGMSGKKKNKFDEIEKSKNKGIDKDNKEDEFEGPIQDKSKGYSKKDSESESVLKPKENKFNKEIKDVSNVLDKTLNTLN